MSDPLSDVAAASGVACQAVERWSFARPFGVRYPGSEHAVVHTVLQGSAVVAGVGKPVRIKTGGAAVLPHDVPHVVASEWPLDEKYIETRDNAAVPPGTVRNYAKSATPDVTIMTMPFVVPGRPSVAPADAQPQIRTLGNAGEDVLEIMLLAGKLAILPGPGDAFALCRLAEAILAKILQRMAGKDEDRLGLFSIFASVGIKAALVAVDRDVRHAWTVRELADIAGMPRKAFEAAFSDTVGTSVTEYISLRRVSRARDAVAAGAANIAEIAASVGFRSRASLQHALKRVGRIRGVL
jgi:AraC-like DNA-binding protein